MGREKHFWAVHLDFPIIYMEIPSVLADKLESADFVAALACLISDALRSLTHFQADEKSIPSDLVLL